MEPDSCKWVGFFCFISILLTISMYQEGADKRYTSRIHPQTKAADRWAIGAKPCRHVEALGQERQRCLLCGLVYFGRHYSPFNKGRGDGNEKAH